MANRFYSPNQQFADNTGLPYANGTLAFYASGTSTPLATYSDSALTIANTNPITLDSAGRAGNIFLQNLAYKVVLSDVNNNVIWTDDPVYSSDFSARAKLFSGAGSPNGNTAGTAGSTGIGADTYWDTTNNILYVCTQTGNAAAAVWTAVNSSAAAAIVPPPQGYLTPTSGTAIITGDVASATSVYYTPYVGNTIPVYNGTSFVPTVFSELQLTLTSGQVANSLYDVFVFNNAGVLTVAVGPAWTTITPGSCARGTGGGTTQLSRLNGLWVNTVSMTAKNSSNTYTIPSSQGTYVGSIFIDATLGQVSCYRSYGQSRKWGIWNAYNRNRIQMKAGDGTASWNYNTVTPRPANNNSANSLTTFTGLPEETVLLEETQLVTLVSVSSVASAGGAAKIGIGLNVTNAFSGTIGNASFNYSQVATFNNTTSAQLSAKASLPPGLGINTITAVESTPTATGTNVAYSGAESSMLLSANYLG